MSKHFHLMTRGTRKASFPRLIARVKFAVMIFIFVLSLVGVNHSVALAAGTTYYVDNTVICSDSGSGTMATPFCTITRGAFYANAGDTVHVLHGTYAETIFPPRSGTEGQPITFHAEPGVTVTGDPAGLGSAFAISTKSYIVIDGFNITETRYKGIYVDSSDHIMISNNHVSYSGDPADTTLHVQGIYLKATTYSTITGNITDHNTCIGIRLVNGSDHNVVSNNTSFANASVVVTDAAGIALNASNYNTVINNVVYDNEDSGINLYRNDAGLPSSYNLVVGNLSYGNGDHGIDHNGSPYNTVIGNTVHGNGTTGINFEGEAGFGSHHATVANNISAGNGFTPPYGSFGGNLRVDSASIEGTTLDYDLFDRQSATVQIIWDNTSYISLAALHAAEPGLEVHGLEGDPRFVTPVASVIRVQDVPHKITGSVGDYHLSAGSPAIDSADSNAPGQLTADIEGKARIDDPDTTNSGAGARTYDDRGAYEFQPSGKDSTTATVACGEDAAVVTYGSSVACVVTVASDTTSRTPTGNVYWATSAGGVFTTSPCILSGSGGTASCSVTYTPHAVGTGNHLITANYAGDANFSPSTGSQTLTVNKKAVVPAITVSNKVYDGTRSATILTQTLTGALSGDVVSLTGGTATFDTRHVGTGKTVIGTGFGLSGSSAANYQLSPSTATTTADITPFTIKVTADAKSKFVGTSDPALTYSVAPALFSGDAFTGQLTRVPGEAEGPYAIQLGSLSAGSNYTIDFVGANLTIVPVPPSNLRVYINGGLQEEYVIQPSVSTRDSYPSVNSGPVKLTSTNSVPVMAAERVIYKVNNVNTSFSEMMGLPNSQLDKTYWLPWYNNVDLDTQLRFANVSNSTATVHVFINGVEMGTGFTLNAGASTRQSFANINNGPVKIVSNVNIVAAERVIYKINNVNTSFSEMMALPDSQLDTTYWLPWYNNKDLDTQLRFANVSNSTATVHVFINGVEMGTGFTLNAGASTRQSFANINNGPVKIVSNVPIVAAERVIYKVNNVNTSFSEMMALPDSQLDVTYWLPWYNNKDLDTQLRFANVSNSTATVHVFVGGVEMGTGFTLNAGASTRVSFANVNGGPVKVVSDVPIVVAERVIYKINNINTSFSELMALPAGQLDVTYWLPWYNNVDLDTQLRFGVP